MSRGTIGIVVSGGPAPGINTVIASSVGEAVRRGYRVVGFRHGFKGLSDREALPLIPLYPESVEESRHDGGSILGTARVNPLADASTRRYLEEQFVKHEIDKLIVIGGEGSAFVSYTLGKQYPELSIVHVPKTIDNDLFLPNQHPSFGFETARFVGTNILNTLITDAKTCQRWFIVTSMGRKAGFLALGLGIASGAISTLIPEEFADDRVSIEELTDNVFRTMEKSVLGGRDYGVIILAEGIIDVLKTEGCRELEECPRDEIGRIKYADLEIGDLLLPRIRERCVANGRPVVVNTKNIGYELRCHHPVSFDIEYTTFLGFGAVRLLDEGRKSVMVTRDFDRISFQSLESMLDETGRMKSRTVDLDSDLYRAARSFMVR